MIWSSSSGRIELNITKNQATIGSHPGRCDADIAYLLTAPGIHRQMQKLDPAGVIDELKEYGAWSEEELQDHQENLARLLWLACGDIIDGNI